MNVDLGISLEFGELIKNIEIFFGVIFKICRT